MVELLPLISRILCQTLKLWPPTQRHMRNCCCESFNYVYTFSVSFYYTFHGYCVNVPMWLIIMSILSYIDQEISSHLLDYTVESLIFVSITFFSFFRKRTFGCALYISHFFQYVKYVKYTWIVPYFYLLMFKFSWLMADP